MSWRKWHSGGGQHSVHWSPSERHLELPGPGQVVGMEKPHLAIKVKRGNTGF